MPVRVRLYPTNEPLPPNTPPAVVATQPYGAADQWDQRPRMRVFEVALLAAAIVSPVFDPTPPPAKSDTFFDRAVDKPVKAALQQVVQWTPPAPLFPPPQPTVPDLSQRPRTKAALQQTAAWLPQGDLVSTPQGWWTTTSDGRKPRSTVALPAMTLDSWQGNVPTEFVPNGWVVAWDGPATVHKPVPAKLQMFQGDTWIGNVPTEFVANAWISQWDPLRKRFPAQAQQVQAATWTPPYVFPEGWVAVYPERFKAPVKAALQQNDSTYPAQGNVPTQFVANAWTVGWEPQRKKVPPALVQDNVPVLAAYSTVAVVFPDGWQVEAPPRSRRPRAAADGVAYGQAAAFQGQAWVEAPSAPQRRPQRAREGFADLSVRAVVPMAWIEAVTPLPRQRQRPDAVLLIPAVTVAYLPPQPVEASPAKQRRGVQVWSSAPPEKDTVTPASPGDTDLWSNIGHKFRRIRPPPPDFHRLFRVAPRIVSQPSLIGVSANPTLVGVSTNPGLLGVSTNPSLLGVSTNPSLLGVSTDPTLLGEV